MLGLKKHARKAPKDEEPITGRGAEDRSRLKTLRAELDEAVEAEDYARASDVKQQIADIEEAQETAQREQEEKAQAEAASRPRDEVSEAEERLRALESEKAAAVEAEDYGRAGELKGQISEAQQALEDARERRERAEAADAARRERAKQLADAQRQAAYGLLPQEPAKRSLVDRILRRKPKEPQSAVEYEVPDDAAQRIVGFEKAFEDGYLKLPDGRYSVAVAFDDANYQSVRRDEQVDILVQWGYLLNSFDSEISFEIWLDSTRIGAAEVGQDIAMHDVNGDPVGNEYREEINALIRSKLASTERSMRKTRCIILTVEAPTHDQARKKLETAITRTRKLFNNLDVSSHVVGGQERLDMIDAMCNQDDHNGLVAFADLDASPGLTCRDLVAPSKVDRIGASDLLVGHRYVRTYIVQKYASTTRDDLLADLTSLSCDSTVSMHVRAWDQEQAINYAESHLDDIELENATYKQQHTHPERGQFVDDDTLPNHMREARDDARAVRDELVKQDQRMFALTISVTVMGKTTDELSQACSEVETVFSEQRLRADWYPEWREQAFTATLPVGNNPLPFTRNLFTDPLTAYIPFTSVEVMDPGGLYLGVNTATHNFILYDRERGEDANGFILGMPGAGKSVQSKWTIEQTRLRYPDDDIIVVDPEREYLKLALAFDGQVVDISENSSDHINLFDLSEYYGSEDGSKSAVNPLPLKVNMLQAAFHMMAHSITDEEMNIIDATAGVIYGPYFESRDPRDLPTLQTFYDTIMATEGATRDDAQHLATLIQRYVSGTVHVFNHQTNVDLSKKLVVFDLQDLGQELKPLALLIILDFVWNRVTRNRSEGRRTWLFIDELQLLLDDEYAVDYFDHLWTRSRKYGLFCTGITQNVTRLLAIPKTSYMVENSHFLTLCKQSPQGAKLLGQSLHLSDSQVRALRTAAPGEGLYIFDRKVINYDNLIPADICPKSYEALTTKFKDIRAYRQMAQGM